MRRWVVVLMLVLTLTCAMSANAAVSTFEDYYLPDNSYWNGYEGTVGFISGAAWFHNNYKDWGAYTSWDGFAYSNMTDTTTPGYGNQYSAITGKGVNGSSKYAVSYITLDWESGTYAPTPARVDFLGTPSGIEISGAYFTNTTYAYLSMQDGYLNAKKFGGPSGEDEDWFRLDIEGVRSDFTLTDPVELYLADFRFDDNSEDYILDEWAWVELSGLGEIIGLKFSLSSSDNGVFGMNTPGYFAMDDLNGTASVPIPGAFWLLGSGIVGLFVLKRNKKS